MIPDWDPYIRRGHFPPKFLPISEGFESKKTLDEIMITEWEGRGERKGKRERKKKGGGGGDLFESLQVMTN